MRNILQSRRVGAAAILASVIIISAIVALGQSGRRVRKAAPVPVETPEASPTPTPKRSPEKPALPVFLGVNPLDLRANAPLYFTDSVGKSCAQRLSQKSTISVELNPRDMTRGNAIKKARDAKTGFVVLLELRRDRMRDETRESDLSMIYIAYSVYSAGTAKQLTSGDVYQQAGYRDILGGGDSTSVAEARLKLAAKIAADRILNTIAQHEP